MATQLTLTTLLPEGKTLAQLTHQEFMEFAKKVARAACQPLMKLVEQERARRLTIVNQGVLDWKSLHRAVTGQPLREIKKGKDTLFQRVARLKDMIGKVQALVLEGKAMTIQGVKLHRPSVFQAFLSLLPQNQDKVTFVNITSITGGPLGLFKFPLVVVGVDSVASVRGKVSELPGLPKLRVVVSGAD